MAYQPLGQHKKTTASPDPALVNSAGRKKSKGRVSTTTGVSTSSQHF